MRKKLVCLRGEKTLTEVAREIGVTRQMLSAIENGTRTPSLDLANKIAQYYSSTIDEIFFDTNCNKLLLL